MTPDRHPLLTISIESEVDIVAVRQRARRVAELLGLDNRDQTRIATAASEIARNAYTYGTHGKAEYALEGLNTLAPMLVVRIADRGPGMANPDDILEGRQAGGAVRGRGLAAARRLVDRFAIETKPGFGTTVELCKAIPRSVTTKVGPVPADIAATLARESAGDMLSAMRDQNRELMRSLDELGSRQEELGRLNAELADTNRGVVALYAELDDKAEQLKRASELKSRFLSYMSHEFRTPLNSILALSRLLIDRVDGALTAEQERQVKYIRQSTESLTELVNDLLDLAKVEAGKLDVRTDSFTADELFRGLRGAFRPLLTSDMVDLVFEEVPADVPTLVTDQGKLVQILRNFISNALKFTQRGEIRVSARFDPAADRAHFSVHDTGIGIDPSEHERLFQEFTQIDSPLQRSVKGTGLGLPLSRRLAELLGGDIEVESAVGAGSTFTLSIPPVFGSVVADPAQLVPPAGPQGRRVLVVDDEATFRYVIRQMIGSEPGYEIIEAANGLEGLQRIRQDHPDVVVLDLHMPHLDGFGVLRELAADPATAGLPVIVSTSLVLDAEIRDRLSGAAAILSKDSLSSEMLSALLQRLVGTVVPGRAAE